MRLIDADDKTLNRKLSYYTCYTGIDEAPYEYATQELDNSPTVPAIPIPENATNGDMIKALFPCLEKYEYEELYMHGIALAGNDNRVTWFANEWWNAPYKAGSEVQE